MDLTLGPVLGHHNLSGEMVMMIRRAVLAAAAAVALILAPSAAMAYNASGFSCTVSDPTPAAGVPFTVVCSGAQPGAVLTLTVTRNPAANFGTKTFTATANANGVATFTVTVAPAGAYSLMVKGASGAVISTQTLKVLGVGAASPPVKGGQLSNTGFEGMPLAVGGGMLVLVGAGAVLISRRRKSAQVPA